MRFYSKLINSIICLAIGILLGVGYMSTASTALQNSAASELSNLSATKEVLNVSNPLNLGTYQSQRKQQHIEPYCDPDVARSLRRELEKDLRYEFKLKPISTTLLNSYTELYTLTDEQKSALQQKLDALARVQSERGEDFISITSDDMESALGREIYEAMRREHDRRVKDQADIIAIKNTFYLSKRMNLSPNQEKKVVGALRKIEQSVWGEVNKLLPKDRQGNSVNDSGALLSAYEVAVRDRLITEQLQPILHADQLDILDSILINREL